MESKMLNQVEFKYLRNAYPLGENLCCYFHTPSGVHVPQPGDWVGLFRVGWKNTKDHKHRKLVSVETIESSKKANIDYGCIVFEKHEVPKDTENYYQFVYVTKNDSVRGVSRPFQFEVIEKELKDELKEIRGEMWNTVEGHEMWKNGVEGRELWKTVEEQEMWKKMEEREREVRKMEREQREIREIEREQLRELREREIREKHREHRELREIEREQLREQVREREVQRGLLDLQRERQHESLKSKLRDWNNNTNNGSCKVVEIVDSELLKEIAEGRSLEKLNDDSVVNSLVLKYLTNLKTKKDEEFVKKFEELFIENNRLATSLKSRVSQVSELKRECDELRLINSELVNKLSSGERKVEVLERELERENRKRYEEETLPSLVEKKRYLVNTTGELDEVKVFLKEENERLREELRRLTVLYRTETENFASLKNRLMKIDETLMKQINKRLNNEKNLSELEEATLVEVKGLKKLIEELRYENESLRARIRSENDYMPEIKVQFPVTSKTTIIKEKSTTHVPKVNSQPEYLSLIETTTTRPISSIESQYPSLSVSTSIPEISSKLTVSGKVPTVQEILFLEQVKKQAEHLRNKTQLIEEQLKEKSLIDEQWKNKSVEEQLKIKLDKIKLNPRHSEMREVREIANDRGVELVYSKESKCPSLWVLSTQQQQQQSMPSSVSEEVKRQQQKQLLRQYEQQAKQQLKEHLSSIQSTSQYSSICPVCGIAVSKELNQTEFELHVNSHFTD